MTPSELEAMVRNLNTRTTAIEQILQTLATNDARPLHEEVKSRVELLAEHLANVPTEIRELREKVADIPELRDDIRRLTKQGAGVKGDIQRLTEQVAVIPELRSDIQQLTDQVAGLAQKIDGSPRRRR